MNPTIPILILLTVCVLLAVWIARKNGKPSTAERTRKNLDTETLILQHNAPDNQYWFVTRQDQDKHTLYAYAPQTPVSTSRLESFFQSEAPSTDTIRAVLHSRAEKDASIHRLVVQDRPRRMFVELRFRNSASHTILNEVVIDKWLEINTQVTK